MDWDLAAASIKEGGIGVIPTDTLYGLVGSALSREAVERIYRIKGRDENKPFILLIDSLESVRAFQAVLSGTAHKFLSDHWPAQLSAILATEGDGFEYLHRATHSLAFRMPGNDKLRAFLAKTGPLVAPSANPQGEKPPCTIGEARAYFGDSMDFYVDGGMLASEPSTIVDLRDGTPRIIRQGAYRVDIGI